MRRYLVNQWWTLGLWVLIAMGGCGDDSGGEDGAKCEVGSEACPCGDDGECDDGLICLSQLCVEDPDAPPNGDGGKRSSGGRSSSNAGGDSPNPGTGGSGADAGPGANGGKTSSGGRTNTPGGGSSSSNGGRTSASGPTPVERHGQLSVSGVKLVGASQEPVKLEGMSSMWLNWEPTGYALDPQGLVWMRDNWNLRLFRIAMGVYSKDDLENTYLADPVKNKAWVNTIVQNAIDAGVYVIIDWHDHEAIEHQAEAIAFFDEMSKRWGEYPNVIYEVFNEPLALDWSTQLKPYHQALVAAIRANDPDNVIVLGTPNWDQDVEAAAASPLSGSNLMYTLHFYACTHGAPIRDRAKRALASGLPLFVTEWGATHADGGVDGVVCAAEASAWHDWMDQANISWAAWKLDGCTDSTCMFKDRTAPVSGGWTGAMLNGHAPFVIEEMTNDPPPSSGSGGSGGTSGASGGSSGSGGSTSGIDLSERPVACELVLNCPTCCETAGVFALDSDEPPGDATDYAVTDWSASGTRASATFDFATANQVGAIFFKFSTLQTISALGVNATASGAPLEVAIVRDGGATGCVYIDSASGWLDNGCWGGTPDGTFDQLEVRVRSEGSGTATLTVDSIDYE